VIASHTGRCRENAVAADEIAALPQRLAGEADRLVVVAADELGISGNAIIQRRGRIPRA